MLAFVPQSLLEDANHEYVDIPRSRGYDAPKGPTGPLPTSSATRNSGE